MSEIKVNKVSPATGTAFTLGDSGDTFTVPSGATIVNSGTATGFGGGAIGQVQYTQITDTESTTSVSFVEIPTLQVTITPSATDSVIMLTCNLSLGMTSNSHGLLQLFRDTTQVGMGDAAGDRGRTILAWRSNIDALTYSAWNNPYQWVDDPASTSAITYTMKWRVNTGTGYLGRSGGDTDNDNNNRSPCSLAAWEILA